MRERRKIREDASGNGGDSLGGVLPLTPALPPPGVPGSQPKGRGSKRWIDLETIRLGDRAFVDCFGRVRREGVFGMLGRMGLAEAWVYLRKAGGLSEGERWRVRMAKALLKLKGKSQKLKVEEEIGVVAADEFCAVLDRVTACVVARNLRKAIDSIGTIGAVVATSHEDLEEALRADVVVRCDFQGRWVWEGRRALLEGESPRERLLVDDVVFPSPRPCPQGTGEREKELKGARRSRPEKK